MTRRYRISAALVAVALGLAGGSSVAEELDGLYFGVSGGLASVDFPSQAEFDDARLPVLLGALNGAGFDVLSVESDLDDSGSAWGVQVGYRFNRYLAAEFGYVNMGEAGYEAIVIATDPENPPFPVESSVRLETSGPTAAVLGMFSFNGRFDLHGKAGVYFADTRIRDRINDVQLAQNIFHNEIDAGEQEIFFGIGAAWNINESYSVRVEFQRFMDVGDDETGEADIDLISGSVLFR